MENFGEREENAFRDYLQKHKEREVQEADLLFKMIYAAELLEDAMKRIESLSAQKNRVEDILQKFDGIDFKGIQNKLTDIDRRTNRLSENIEKAGD